MAELISDIVGYLKAVFVESQQLVFTAFDILGIALFFFPNLAGRLIGNESLVRTIGGFIFLGSFILANFLVYRRVAGEMSGKANIELKVLAKDFSPSLGTRPSPFRGVRGNPGGFDKQGLPDWGSLWARIRAANIGYERGELICDLDKARTKLPSLFDCNKVKWGFPIQPYINGRDEYSADFFFDVLFTEQDTRAFAQALKVLIESKQRYQVVMCYRTRRVDGESKTRALCIEVDFQHFYQKVLEHWDGFGFRDLADLARLAEP